MMENPGAPGDIRAAVEAHAVAHDRTGADPLSFYAEYDAAAALMALVVTSLQTTDNVLTLAIAALQATVLTGRNTSDFVKNNDTTLANVTGLKVTLAANTVYKVDISIMYNSGATPNLKFQVNPPSGATGVVWAHYYAFGAYQSFNSFIDSLTAVRVDGLGLGYANAGHILLQGLCITTNAGDLQIQAAQNTANASNTTVMAGSSIVAVKVA